MIRTLTVFVVVGLALATGIAGLSGVVGATPHGAEGNYTVIPQDAPSDRRPGNEDASYRQFGILPRRIEYLDYLAATWRDGGFEGCSASSTSVFGIDRDNDAPGTTVDVDLRKYIEEATTEKHYFEANFYEKEDAIGDSTYIDADDQTVSVVDNCYDNPAQPGWYQIQSTIAGWTKSGKHVVLEGKSHYFAVCDCASRAEARDRLGPPPSRTPTPTATASDGGTDAAAGTPTATDATPAAGTLTPTPTPVTAAPARTATERGGTATPASDDRATTSTPTPTNTAAWGSVLRQTPTAARGPAPQVAGLVAMLAGAMLAVRRGAR